jgi:hypothetical protein
MSFKVERRFNPTFPQIDFGWTLLHAADDECTAVGSVDQGFSGSSNKNGTGPVLIKRVDLIRAARAMDCY